MGILVKDVVKNGEYKYALIQSITVSFPRRLNHWDHVNQARLCSLEEVKEEGKCTKKWVGGTNTRYKQWRTQAGLLFFPEYYLNKEKWGLSEDLPQG